ncbi:MAG TPA: efflux RND transporter periplasmic adaptor subunit [Alphaproteobacteria bacterium]|nr:efflux RND transporter periplasmic adaptor subunit [Alphaproteobacteria bacterium]
MHQILRTFLSILKLEKSNAQRVFLALGVVFLGLFIYKKNMPKEKKEVFLEVSIKSLQKEARSKVFIVPATAQAINDVPIKSLVTQNIKEIHVKTGQDVKKGDLLFTLDTKTVETEIQKNKIVLSNTDVQLAHQEKKKARSVALNQKGVVSNQALEDDEVVLNKLSFQKDEILKTLQSLEITRDNHFIRAPFEGRLGIVDLGAGALIQANIDVLTTIITIKSNSRLNIPLNPYRYEVLKNNLDKLDIAYEKQEQPLSGTCTFQGFDNKVTQSDGMIYLRADCSSSSQTLLEGMHVRATLTLKSFDMAFKIPPQCLFYEFNDPFVWVVDDKDTVQKRKVKIALQDEEDDYWIAQGLEEGEKIVLNHILDLHDQQKITPKEEKTS